jgi:hypothetical protein
LRFANILGDDPILSGHLWAARCPVAYGDYQDAAAQFRNRLLSLSGRRSTLEMASVLMEQAMARAWSAGRDSVREMDD